jgi:WD40 repeat protein
LKNKIDSLEWVSTDSQEFIVGYQNGDVKIFDLFGKVNTHYKCSNGVVGLHVIENEKILSCTSTGEINLTNRQNPSTFLETYSTGRNVTHPLYNSHHQQLLMTGSKNRLAEIYDINTGKLVWKARNVPKDFLDLRVPIWDRDAHWVDEAKRVFVTVTAFSEVDHNLFLFLEKMVRNRKFKNFKIDSVV